MTIHLISYAQPDLTSLKEIAMFFSPVKFYLPWGTERPEVDKDTGIEQLFPPDTMKPEADFNLLLNECFNWAYEQGETSRRELAKTGRTNPISDESLRHIKTILGNKISPDTSEKDRVIRWHMLLHLAGRLEQDRSEANRMLADLNKMPSPLLKNADLTEKTEYPLENLTGIGSELLISEANSRQLLRAWYGLYHTSIKEREPLLTTDRNIFNNIFNEWDTCSNKGLGNTEVITFKCPMPDRLEMGSSGITAAGKAILDILLSDSGTDEKKSAIEKITGELESQLSQEDAENYLSFSLLFFNAPEGIKETGKDALIEFLSGRALLLAEKHA